MKRLLALLATSLAPQLATAQDHTDYAVGQVWEYHTRAQDTGSLLKIQRIENDPAGRPIYHISIVGVTVLGRGGNSIGHLPVSRETLDARVIRLSSSDVEFPNADEGIEIWRADNGGVFTISVATAVEYVDSVASKRAN